MSQSELSNVLRQYVKLRKAESELREQMKTLDLKRVRTILRDNLPLNKPTMIEENPPKYIYTYMKQRVPPANLKFVMTCIYKFLSENQKKTPDECTNIVNQYMEYIKHQQTLEAQRDPTKYNTRELKEC
jgi:hypothetical protein